MARGDCRIRVVAVLAQALVSGGLDARDLQRPEQPITHLRNLVDYFVSRYLFIASSRFCRACPYSAKLPPC
jgi:hypothetical protein